MREEKISYSIFRNITTIWNKKGYGFENKSNETEI